MPGPNIPRSPLGRFSCEGSNRFGGEIEAFNSSCPHAGCSVGYRSKEDEYYCPCHESIFNLDGSRGDPCVSPRGLDSLEVDEERLGEGGVWVTFRNFAAGIEEKKAI